MGRRIKVILQPVTFRNRTHICILSPDDTEVDAVIREIKNVEWSTGYHFWHLPYNSTIVKELKSALKGIALVDSSSLSNVKFDKKAEDTPKQKRIKPPKPSQDQLNQIQKFCTAYHDKGYGEGTVKVYNSLLSIFFGYFATKNENEITINDIEDFIAEYIEKNNLTTNYKRLMKNTLRRYFQFIEREEITSF
ncbi:MAG: site-specific integrase [Prolixibacteraceae bacterium]